MPSHDTIPKVRMLSRRARLRRSLRFFFSVGGRALLVASVAGLLAVAADVLIGLPVAWWAVGAAFAAVSVVVSLALTLARSGTLLQAANEVDRNLGLEDRVASALSFSERDSADSFVRLALREGEEASERTDARRAIPIRFDRNWTVWPALCAVWIGLGLVMPRYDLMGERARQEIALEQESTRALAKNSILQARDELAQSLESDPAETRDVATDESLRTLEQLAEELEMGEVEPDEAREKAAGALDETAREMERRAEESAAAERARNEILESLGESGEGDRGAVRELRESLANGDMENAARALDEIREQADTLTPEEAEELRQSLEQLAQDLEDAGEQEQESVEQERAEERDELNEWGLDETQAEELQELGDEESIRDRLEEQGFDENAANRTAEKISESERDRRAREQAARETKELGEDLRESSDELSGPDRPQDERQPEAGDPRDPESTPPGGEEQPGSAQEENRSEQPSGNERRPREEDSPQGQRPGEMQQQNEGQQSQNEPQENGESRQEPTGEMRDEGSPGMQSGEENARREGAPTSQPDTAPQDQQGADGQQRGREQTGQNEGDRPGQARPTAGENRDGDASGGSGLKKLQERLEEMQRRGGESQKLREQSKSARDKAQELLDEMSPEERERLSRWIDEQRRENAGRDGFETESVDARDKDDSNRVVGETTNPNWQAQRGEDRVSERELADELREAARSNSRALEERSVPSKYRNVEEYFRQAIRRAEEAEKAKQAAPVKSAEDAKSDGK